MTELIELFNACLYIQDNLEADLSLLLLARTVGLSRFRFHRVFKAWRGETLHDFVTRMRMERAAFELRYPVPRSSRRSIKAIAVTSGYKSLSSFSHAFSSYARLSPRAFRNRALREKPPVAANVRAASSPMPFGPFSLRVAEVPVREITLVDLTFVPDPRRRLAALATLASASERGGDRYGVELLPDLLARATSHAGAASRATRLSCVGIASMEAETATSAASPRTTLRLAGGRYAIVEGEGSVAGLYRAWRRGFDAWLAVSGECPKPDRVYLRFPSGPVTGSSAIALYVPLEDLASPA